MKPSPSPSSKYCKFIGYFVFIFVVILLYALLATGKDAYKIHSTDSVSFKGSKNLKSVGESTT